jgi:cytochrome c oxidase subunit 4
MSAHSTTSHDAHAHSDGHGHGDHHHGEFSHPASIGMLLTIFVILLLLTALTVYQSTLDLGKAEIIVSLAIATIKAGLVIMFFMHMLWDKLLNGIIFFSSLIFVALFLGFTLMDAESYRASKINQDTLQESIPKAPEAAHDGGAGAAAAAPAPAH